MKSRNLIAILILFGLGSLGAAPLAGVGFDQKLDGQIPLTRTFHDENGSEVRLANYFGGGRPMILVMAYYRCPNLCTLVLNGLTESLRKLGLRLGIDYGVLTVSIDPNEKPSLALAKQRTYLARYAKGGNSAWHFLTGSEESIRGLASAIGFRYKRDELSGEYAHPSGIVILTPSGKISRYFFGVEFIPRDLRLALVEASRGRIGSAIDQFLLFCFHYDPLTGKYTMLISRILQAAGLLTILALIALFRTLQRGEAAA